MCEYVVGPSGSHESHRFYREAAGRRQVCGDGQRGLTCRWRDSKKIATGAGCVLLDDQFGYIPARLAEGGGVIFLVIFIRHTLSV